MKAQTVQMKLTESVKVSITIFYVFSTCISIVWTLYSGAWCPYQTEKVIPCRIRNGSEPYYGPNICWRNDNGSYACTKKILYRPKFVTTYKKVLETQYKCCPGRSGMACEKECFNCTTYQKLEARVAATERRLSRLEYPKPTTERSERLHRDYNSIYAPISKDVEPDTSALVYATLNSRLQKLLDEFRDLHSRIRLIENEMSRMNTQVDDLTLSSSNNNNNNNIAYDIRRDSNNGKDSKSHKDSPDMDEANNNGIVQKSMPSLSPATPHVRHPPKTESTFRVLEENLERGDIASTLNDDYGDDIYSDNSTEQYIDQLQLKRENSP